jgi:Na+-transporting methylmalonyl-CoA/oxaloacetate decarboxylase gamma subunit
MNQKQDAAKLLLALMGIGFSLLVIIVIVAFDIEIGSLIESSITQGIEEELAKKLQEIKNF